VESHELLSTFAFRLNLRRCNWVLALMLPKIVIAELKSGSSNFAAHFKEASVLFIDISDFAALSATLEASQLVSLLNFIFSTFDDALEAFGSAVYKAGAYTRPLFSSI
jgi:class 3 adenylate cyclase